MRFIFEIFEEVSNKFMSTFKNFNLIVNGVGGQGLITLLKIISEAALGQGYDIRTSELHGLSQRGGSVETYIRFGKKIWSPLIIQGKADLVIALETQEALNSLYYASKNTSFLINRYMTPTFAKNFSEKEVLDNIRLFSREVNLVSAEEICQKELGNPVVSGVYLLGCAVSKKLLPLKKEAILAAIKKTIPEKNLELNIKAFNLSSQKVGF